MSAVLITGATSGIGKQLALDYANNGTQVIACGRNLSVLKELSESSNNIHTIACDLTDLAETKKAFASLPVQPSTWIFNAGNCEYIEKGELDSALFKRVFDINVMGVVHSIEATQSQYKQQDRVVIVGSIASALPLPRAEAYGASKAAIDYLAKTLKVDLQHKGIDVSVVYPGFVDTPLTQKNTFAMPMIVTAQQASKAIRDALRKGKSFIYFPAGFTWTLRMLRLLPSSWQIALGRKLING